MRFTSISSVLLVFLQRESTANSGSLGENGKNPECTLYLAPSMIQGGGLGLYSAIAYEEGVELKVPTDIVIPVGSNSPDEDPSLDIFRNYNWQSMVGTYHLTQFEALEFVDLVSGIGAIPNHDAEHCNVFHYTRDTDGALVDLYQRPHPGTDAYSPYHYLPASTLKNIKAGAELLIDYGDNYFKFRENAYPTIPYSTHYEEARELMQKFVETHLNNDSKAWMNTTGDCDSGGDCAKDIKASWESVVQQAQIRTRTALPKDVERVIQSNGTEFALGEMSRSIEWLQENGQCMSYYNIGASQIFEAGRGAFASITFKEGDIISPCPVMQMNRTLQMIDHRYGGEAYTMERLLLNYCYSHPETSLMLCPYGTASLSMNHAKTPNSGDVGKFSANAKIQISSSNQQFEELSKLSPRELMQANASLGWFFDIVATRDIEVGEELFIDYGDDWQKAWDAHIDKWQHLVRDDLAPEEIEPVVKHCNASYPGIAIDAPYPTPECIASDSTANSMLNNPEIVTVHTGCFYFPDWDQMDQYSQYVVLPWRYALDSATTGGLFPCKVLAKEGSGLKDQEKYTVMVLLDHNENGEKDEGSQSFQLVRGVPFNAFRRVTPLWRNLSVVDHNELQPDVPRPLRHYMRLSDELLPIAWRDLI